MFMTVGGKNKNNKHANDRSRDRNHTQSGLVYCVPSGTEVIWQKEMFAAFKQITNPKLNLAYNSKYVCMWWKY